MARRLALALLALVALLEGVARATWSIVLVDAATGEVAVGSATCLAGFDIKQYVPVIVVGRGGAVAQSMIDGGAQNRAKIVAQLQLGTPPEQIIEYVLQGDGLNALLRQYGIVDASGAAATYTGSAVGAAKKGVTGTVGTVSYAIQGNVLAGKAVINAAEAAVIGTSGTLADRLLAGMVAAAGLGGDGRCSCNPTAPTLCGAPPPSFTKSAHVAQMAVARPGDVDGPCNSLGCASGSYWLDLNVPNQFAADPDPVAQLQAQYTAFLADRAGHPDGFLSLKALDHDVVLGDGVSTRRLHVALHDLHGQPITAGGARFTVTHAEGSAGLAQLLAVEDHGAGRYTLLLQAGLGEGLDLLAVRVDDGSAGATLFPWVPLQHRPALGASAASLSNSRPVTLQLQGPSDAAGQLALVALSASGTAPGLPVGPDLLLPLVPDALFGLTGQLSALGIVPGNPTRLDGAAAAQLELGLPGPRVAALFGSEVAVAWLTLRPTGFVGGPLVLDVLP